MSKMEWSLLSPSSSPTEIHCPTLCEVKDEQAQFFPSKPIPGMLEYFQPLLVTLDKCIGYYPVALVEEVEEMLKKDYPNVISDQKLISFNEYVHLARLRGIPIRCDQAFSKPKYMWFQHNKGSWLNTSTTDQAVNVDVKDTETLVQSTVIEDQPEPNVKHDNIKEENLDLPENVISASTESTQTGQEGENKVNGPDNTSKLVEEDKISEPNSLEKIPMGNIRHFTRREFSKLKFGRAHYSDFINDFCLNRRKRDKMQNYEKLQIFIIIISIIKDRDEDKDKYAFCEDSDLLKLVEIIVTIIIRNLHRGSAIPASLLQLSIQNTYPKMLESQLDSKSEIYEKEKITSLLLRLSKQGLNMPIVFRQDLIEINISEALELVDTYRP